MTRTRMSLPPFIAQTFRPIAPFADIRRMPESGLSTTPSVAAVLVLRGEHVVRVGVQNLF